MKNKFKLQRFVCPCCKHMTKLQVQGSRVLNHKAEKKQIVPSFKEVDEITIIKKIVLEYFKLSDKDFCSRDRYRDLVLARHYFFYLCDFYLNIKLDKVGFLAGGRDRTTVWHGIQTIRGFIEVNGEDAKHLEALRSQIVPSNYNPLKKAS